MAQIPKVKLTDVVQTLPSHYTSESQWYGNESDYNKYAQPMPYTYPNTPNPAGELVKLRTALSLAEKRAATAEKALKRQQKLNKAQSKHASSLKQRVVVLESIMHDLNHENIENHDRQRQLLVLLEAALKTLRYVKFNSAQATKKKVRLMSRIRMQLSGQTEDPT